MDESFFSSWLNKFKLLANELTKIEYTIYAHPEKGEAYLKEDIAIIRGNTNKVKSEFLKRTIESPLTPEQAARLLPVIDKLINELTLYGGKHPDLANVAREYIFILELIEGRVRGGEMSILAKRPLIEVKELEAFLIRELAEYIEERKDINAIKNRFGATSAEITALCQTENALGIELAALRGHLVNAVSAINRKNFGGALSHIQQAEMLMPKIITAEANVHGEIGRLRTTFGAESAFIKRLNAAERDTINVTQKLKVLLDRTTKDLHAVWSK